MILKSRYLSFILFMFLMSLAVSCSSLKNSVAQDSQSSQEFQKKVSKVIKDGGVILAQLTLDKLQALNIQASEVKTVSVAFEGHSYTAFYDQGRWLSLVAIPFNTPPRTSELLWSVRSVKTTSKNSVNIREPVEVVDGNYPQEKIQVESKYTQPDPRTMARIQREQKQVAALYLKHQTPRLWKGNFSLPIASKENLMSSRYGGKRMFNGEMKSFHQGLDLRAVIDTPVMAPERGRVVLAQDLFFTGNTLILDHGMGLFSIYAHLNHLKVKVGDEVQKEQWIALSGKTGRASGPHLHWGIVIHSQKVDPEILIQELQQITWGS